eukprot:CAMPEP_0170552968 /NCGR_PEP_ID=MMETSP0211-20121228/10859_1 /TAXON_ID=311385 /ORGANISM="Pseudokeronopsis sp., Strain OXSARD2" /LENGTH=94 /DNA_ID=CAMNT_0010861061 /DNA_START=2292 /DNA_END=2576 /DNA_ORIENTATION=+
MFLVLMEVYGSMYPILNSELYDYKKARFKSLEKLQNLEKYFTKITGELLGGESGPLFQLLGQKLKTLNEIFQKIKAIFEKKAAASSAIEGSRKA